MSFGSVEVPVPSYQRYQQWDRQALWTLVWWCNPIVWVGMVDHIALVICVHIILVLILSAIAVLNTYTHTHTHTHTHTQPRSHVSGMVLKDEQLMAIQHIYNCKDVFVRLPDTASCYMVLQFVFVLRIHFEKTEATYCHDRFGHRTTVACAWCSSRIFLHNISPCYYLLFQLMYCDEFYGECNGWRVDTRRSSPILLSAWERG